MKPDLQIEQSNVRKMVAKGGSIRSIYTKLRRRVKFQSIGDYPIIAFICSVAKEAGIELSKKSIIETLKNAQDGEFKRVREDSQIVRQLCA